MTKTAKWTVSDEILADYDQQNDIMITSGTPRKAGRLSSGVIRHDPGGAESD